MKNRSICVLAAAAVLTTAGAIPAYASALTCNIPGGKMMIIGGGGCDQAQNLFSGIKLPDCLQRNWPDMDFSGVVIPDVQIPGTGNADILVPGQEDTGNEAPGSGAQAPGTEDPGSEAPGSSVTTDRQDIQEVLDLVNAERARAGVPALSLHSGATKAAQIRAQEISVSFSHTRPDGSQGVTALDQAGVSYRGFGENIAYGQRSASEVMEQWMNSSGHRANILNGSFTSIGIGHYKDANGVDYWTQMFLY